MTCAYQLTNHDQSNFGPLSKTHTHTATHKTDTTSESQILLATLRARTDLVSSDKNDENFFPPVPTTRKKNNQSRTRIAMTFCLFFGAAARQPDRTYLDCLSQSQQQHVMSEQKSAKEQRIAIAAAFYVKKQLT